MPPLPLANRVGSLAEAEDPYASTSRLAPRLASRSCACCRPATSSRDGACSTSAAARDGRCATSSTRPTRPRSGAATSTPRASIGFSTTSARRSTRCATRPSPACRSRTATSTSSGRSRCSPIWWTPWAAWLLELHRVLADDGILIATTIGPRHSEHYRQGGLGGGPHRHERASPLGLLGGRRARGPSLDLVAARPLGPSLRDPRDRRVAGGRGADQRRLYLVGVHEPSLACDAKARCHPHRRGSRAPRARRAARAHRRAPQRPAVAGRARSRAHRRGRHRPTVAARARASSRSPRRAGTAAARETPAAARASASGCATKASGCASKPSGHASSRSC